jgi:ABC-type uncharacterized transport system YnjBCD permease subunit
MTITTRRIVVVVVTIFIAVSVFDITIVFGLTNTKTLEIFAKQWTGKTTRKAPTEFHV